MTVQRAPHRPQGSGHHVIRIRQRSDNPGYWVFIGRFLWQAIGQPALLEISREEGGWVIAVGRSDDHYTVSNIDQDGMPRLTVGAKQLTELGLHEGTYPATAFASRELIMISDDE